jgi:adenylosuccinate synthase
MSFEKSDSMGIQEFGTVTHRKRRIGGWDGDMARYSAMVNGCTQAAITGIDRIDKACFGITDYNKLTRKAKDFLRTAEDDIGYPITLISTGPEVTQIIDIREEMV